ncbi:hypothetical protein F2Q69_00059479 [Brassica cretica]|uniref:Retrotransposon gag domain-containing protein n=1 Tax=Brassica cretica TaxID=69181 RepID=A0A8S9RN44_BRACR|nr:hypothetical protein F2Q69_00059479 [Brassica cretica]
MLRHCSSNVEVLFIRCRGTVRLDTVHPTLIDTVHPTSIDTVHFPSIDIVHPASIDTVLRSTVHCNTVHLATVHLALIDTVHRSTVHRMLCIRALETEKIEVLILKVDENEMLRDEEGRIPNSAGQFINAQGAVIPDVIVVAEMNDFDLSRECWFSQLQPGSLISWDDIERVFLYKFLDDVEATREKEKNDKWDRFLASLDEEYMIPIQLLDEIMAKGMNNMDLESRAKEKKLRLVIGPQHRTTPAPQHRSTVRSQRRPTTRSQHRSTLPLHRRSTVGAYQSRRSSMYVKILGMEIHTTRSDKSGG